MSPGGGKVKKSGLPYLIGSATSGVMEIGLFHPVDTVAKRLMSSQKSVFLAGGKGIDSAVLSSIIFKENVGKGVLTKLYGLFPGASFGVAYKVLQRTYKWGGQPLMKGAMDKRFGEAYRNAFGQKNGNDLMHASAGALIGAGEVFLLPLDVLKIKMQVNPEALAGRGVLDIFKNEGFALYRGWNWTIARNMPGSFALFGANSLVYTRIFGTGGPKESSFGQIFAASMFGGFCSISVSSPMDVIKTRIQNKAFDDPRSGASLVKDLLKEEGPTAFFKGLTPKLGLVGPKLVFGFTVAQWLISRLDDYMHANSAK